MEWRGEQYSLNTLFSEWATPVTDPTNILDVVIGAMDPNTWFETAEYETRTGSAWHCIPSGWRIEVGALADAGCRGFIRQSRTDGKSGYAIWRYSRSDPFPVLGADIGISKWGDETSRVPAGLMIKTGKKGFECGIQASDVQALWKPSQPEVGFRMVAMRWVW